MRSRRRIVDAWVNEDSVACRVRSGFLQAYLKCMYQQRRCQCCDFGVRPDECCLRTARLGLEMVGARWIREKVFCEGTELRLCKRCDLDFTQEICTAAAVSGGRDR